VLNGEDAAVRALPGDAPGARWYFRTDRALDAHEGGAWIDAQGRITVRFAGPARALLNTAELRILGRHNHANALAATVAATAAGAGEEAVIEGLRTFGGLEHRLEVVAERDGVVWINDSKATNVASTRVALRSMARPTVLLLGGRGKNESFAQLLPDMTGVRAVIAFGEAGDRIVSELTGHVIVERAEDDLTEVVRTALKHARAGDVLLLSPACASFDMFHDYEHRGRAFKALAGAAHG
jgi:UDP-N-acetylmuramoylalanine--D-glutamate ligase